MVADADDDNEHLDNINSEEDFVIVSIYCNDIGTMKIYNDDSNL